MKKLMALLAALLLTLPAVAETPDLTDCTMEELLLLRQQVDAAMVDLARSVDRSDASLDGLIWVSNGSEVRINAYEGTATEVVVPAEIDGVPVTRLQAGVFQNCKTVRHISLPDTITEIPNSAFNGCANLITVNIPSATICIGRNAFQGCDALKTVTLPEGLKTLGRAAFMGANELSGVIVLPSTLGSLDDFAFSNCNKMLGVVVQSNLELTQCCFSGDSLEFVYIREGAAVSIERNDIFSGNLRMIIIPASVTYIIPRAFEYCNHLTVVTPAGSYAEQFCRDNWIVCNTKDYDKYVAEYEALLAQ